MLKKITSKKENWFGMIIATCIIVVISVSFVRFYGAKDFIQYNAVPCDNTTTSCFVRECSEDDPRCAPYMSEEGLYYFAVEKEDGGQITTYTCGAENSAYLSDFLLETQCSE